MSEAGAGAGAGAGASGASNQGGSSGAGAAGGSGGAAGGQASGSDWHASISGPTKDWIQAKGFQNVNDLADTAYNLEKLRGVPKERLLALPESMDTPEGQAIWERLGRPKEAKGYNLQTPKDGDSKFAEWAADNFLKSNLTAKQGEALMKAWNERQEAFKAQSIENQKVAINQGTEALKKEWGQAYDQNIELAKKGVRVLEIDGKTLDQLQAMQGTEKLFKTLQKLGAAVGESPFIAGAPAANGAVTPEAARHQINEMRADQGFIKRMLDGDMDAKRQWQRAHEMAYPGEKSFT